MEKEVFPHFTPDVMSGDEEDSSYVPPPRLRCKRFIIRSMVWRNPALVDFCRVLDALYFSLRHLENGKWSRGHFPDERLRCGRTGPGRTVPGLPHNFYNPTWLATLDPLEIEMLDMQPSVDLNFSEEIRRSVEHWCFILFFPPYMNVGLLPDFWVFKIDFQSPSRAAIHPSRPWKVRDLRPRRSQILPHLSPARPAVQYRSKWSQRLATHIPVLQTLIIVHATPLQYRGNILLPSLAHHGQNHGQ